MIFCIVKHNLDHLKILETKFYNFLHHIFYDQIASKLTFLLPINMEHFQNNDEEQTKLVEILIKKFYSLYSSR